MKISRAEYAILSTLLLLYILMGHTTPVMVTQVMYSGVGLLLVILFVVYLFYRSDIYLTLLSVIAACVLLYRTTNTFVSNIPGMTKSQQYMFYNTPPTDTLEQDIVKLRIPNSEYRRTANTFGQTVQPMETETTLPIYSIV
jgi:hypothetical protein